MSQVKQFNDYRSKMNEKILASDSLIIKRIFNLDTNAYAQGALDVKSKELIGLTCSLVLRCDDCVKYHLGKCKELNFSTAEVHEAMGAQVLDPDLSSLGLSIQDKNLLILPGLQTFS